jgi:hypothetical protein
VWSQNISTYFQTAKNELDYSTLRAFENLVVSPLSNTSIIVYNPTSEVIVLTQIWSNHVSLFSGEQGVSPFGSVNFNTNDTRANGQYQVITSRGNLFSGSVTSQFDMATRQTWSVSWYYAFNMASDPANNYTSLIRQQSIGKSYWNDLNFEWSWPFNTSVIANKYNMTNGALIGFAATATIIKTSDNNSVATINWIIDNQSGVQFGIDGPPASAIWYRSPQYVSFNIYGPLYSTHTITVYFDGYRGPGQSSDHYLRLNLVNATFAP